jgi:hypothetical protein
MEVGVRAAGRRARLSLAVLGAALLAACARGPAALPSSPVEGYPVRDARGGIRLGLEPYLTPDQARGAFAGGEDFRARGLLAVRVQIENGSQTPVQVDPHDAMLVHPRHGQAPSLVPDEALAMVKLPVGWWAVGAGYVGGSAQAYRNEARRRDIEGRALRAQTVPPGGTAAGFLYFAVPENDVELTGSRILLAVRDAAGRAAGFELVLPGPRAPARAAAPDAARATQEAPPPGTIIGTGGRGIIIRRPAP